MVSSFYVAGNYAVGLVLFFFVFYLDFTPGEIEEQREKIEELKQLEFSGDEEKELLLEKNLNDLIKKEDIKEKKKEEIYMKYFYQLWKIENQEEYY